MPRRSLAVLTAILLLAAPVPATAAVSDDDPWTTLMTRSIVSTSSVPGSAAPASWAVLDDPDGPARTGGTGGADADTPFLLGSLSKPLTAAVVLQLADAGTLALDDPVDMHLPGFRPQDARPITIADLLRHTSGFSTADGLDAIDDPALTIDARAARADAVERHDPAFAYSNLNFAVLAAVVERVTGAAYAEHLGTALFDPLGMRDSSADPTIARTVAATGHLYAFGIPYRVDATAPEGAAADGFTVSTARDYAKFLRMLLSGGVAEDGTRILSEQSVAGMLAEQVPAPDAAAPGTSGYGYGWGTGRADGGEALAAHIGRTDTFFAHVVLLPETARGAVVLHAVNGWMYDQTGPARTAIDTMLVGGPGETVGEPAGEPAVVTAGVFAAAWAIAAAAVLISGAVRARRDRRGTQARPPMVRRAIVDIVVAALVVALWFVGAGMALGGRPLAGITAFAASTELTALAIVLALVLVARAVLGVVRSRLPRTGLPAPER